QARSLDLIGQPFAPHIEQVLGALPGTAPPRSLKAPVVLAVEIGENAILIRQHRSLPLRLAAWRLAVGRALRRAIDGTRFRSGCALAHSLIGLAPDRSGRGVLFRFGFGDR